MSTPIILILIGILCSLVGKISLIIAAFKQSVVWGLCVLFVPFASLVFLVRYWEEAKQPFLCSLVGGVLIGSGFYIGRDELAKSKEFASYFAQIQKLQAATGSAPKQKEETPEQRHERIKADFPKDAAELKAKYDALQLQWASLKPDDKAGRTAFDKEAAIYQEMRKKVEAEKAEAEAPAASSGTPSH